MRQNSILRTSWQLCMDVVTDGGALRDNISIEYKSIFENWFKSLHHRWYVSMLK